MGARRTKDSYVQRSWWNTLDRLSEETGVSLNDVCGYIGAAGAEGVPGFYIKMPRRRSTFIGIGRAFKQPVEVINQWITGFAGKKRL